MANDIQTDLRQIRLMIDALESYCSAAQGNRNKEIITLHLLDIEHCIQRLRVGKAL